MDDSYSHLLTQPDTHTQWSHSIFLLPHQLSSWTCCELAWLDTMVKWVTGPWEMEERGRTEE